MCILPSSQITFFKLQVILRNLFLITFTKVEEEIEHYYFKPFGPFQYVNLPTSQKITIKFFESIFFFF